MKKVEAFIKPDKLSEVIDSLHHLDGISDVHLFEMTRKLDWKKFESLPGRENVDSVEEVSQVKIEIFCKNDSTASDVIFEIEKTACSGERGDGEIYVSDVEIAERIKMGRYIG